jgi:precorrin-8X/cobalt-precorrin-8 methylmutase
MADSVRDLFFQEKQAAISRIPNEELNSVTSQIEAAVDEPNIKECIHFSSGVLNRIEYHLKRGCSLIADTRLILGGLDAELCAELSVNLKCFLDNPQVINQAKHKRVTRAEIAVDVALALPGPKIMIVGSAPMALKRMLNLHATSPLVETTIIAAANGFANIVEIKERVWDSGIPCIVVRGRNGGVNTAIAVTNVLLNHVAHKN